MTAKLTLRQSLMAAAGLASLLAVAPAFAADVVQEEPPAPAAPMEVPPLNTWSGPYAGVTVGYGFSGRLADPVGNSISTDGFIGGGFAGFNIQSNDFVAGVEADVGYNGVKGDDFGLESKGGVDGSLRARLGYAVGENVLLYATGGGALRSVGLSDGVGSDRNTALGWTVGAGADIKLTQQVFGRVEYRYTDYGRDTYSLPSGDYDLKSKDNRIMFGVGMKF